MTTFPPVQTNLLSRSVALILYIIVTVPLIATLRCTSVVPRRREISVALDVSSFDRISRILPCFASPFMWTPH